MLPHYNTCLICSISMSFLPILSFKFCQFKQNYTVLRKDNGDLLSPDSVTQWLNKFSAANNLPHLHPHAFRHTVASTMIAAGVDLVTTANELGHASASTTANFYAHEIATAKAKASQVRANVFDTK